MPVKRHRHTENYKQEVIAHVAELRQAGGGETGIYLRREGLYFSTVKKWEKKIKDENKVMPAGTKEKALADKVKLLEKELERTRKKLEKSELIIEF